MADPVRLSASRRAADVLGSLPFLLSIGVLLLNDHVLKATRPGLITGKLSDVAGVVMIALLATAATRHPGIAFSFTIVGFGFLKTIPTVAESAAPMLGGVTTTDPTDLLALLALAPLWRWVARGPAPRTNSVASPRLALRAVAVSAAVLATTATSCDEQGLTEIGVYSDGVVVAGDHESVDGGITWTTSERGGLALPEDGSCVAAGTCYEIDGQSVVAIDGGLRDVILVVDNGFESELPELDGMNCNVGPWQSVSAVDLDDGRHVIVAMGAHGALHLGPDRRWEWVAVGEWGMPSSAAGTEPFDIPIASTVGGGIDWALWVLRLIVLLVPAGVFALARPIGALARSHRRNRSEAISAVNAVAAGTFVLAVGLLVLAGTADLAGLILVGGIVGLGLLAGSALLGLLIYYGTAPRHPERPVMPPPSPHDRVG